MQEWEKGRKKGKEREEEEEEEEEKTMTADPGDGLLPGGLPGTVYSFRWAVIGWYP